MKKSITLAIALMCMISLSAQNDAAKTGGKNPQSQKEKTENVSKEQKEKIDKKAAVIEFEKLEHDYGTVPKGGNGVYEFKFKNAGKTPLKITNVRSSCGCTIPVWPKEEIPPKKSATITVKYDTNRVGPISKTVTVESDASNNRIQLKIKGTVVEKPAEKAPENGNSSLENPNK
ncbi:MAG: DUF1573 domain-containing protein [Bacteroidales bacterium]|jgi:hypothetical protein|nr:DUF1573 domain-containing protein [Bacteroidales bacterium]